MLSEHTAPIEASPSQGQKILGDIEKVVLSVVPTKSQHDRESIAPEGRLIKRSGGVLNPQTARDYTFVPGTIDG